MRGLIRGVVLSIVMLSLSACAQNKKNQAEDFSADLAWPRRHDLNGQTLLIYQPQIESWEGNQLSAQAAVAVTPKGQDNPEFGIVWITARTEIDKDAHMVTLENVVINKVSFPEDRAHEAQFLKQINDAVPDTVKDVPLDHLEANLAITNAEKRAAAVEVKNPVPVILFSTAPSILILIDGSPVLRSTGMPHVMRVVNTRQLMLLNEDSKEYSLSLMGKWVSGPSPKGPWAPTDNVHAGYETLKETLAKEQTVDLLIPSNPSGAPQNLPAVYVEDQPAELIQSRGEPEYAPVEGTNLLYMKNTESAVFMMLGTSEYYVLVSGRWFKAPSLKGPWAFVPGAALPPDFSRIPPGSDKANVLVSVPGTSQAGQAVIANSIPQTATVNIAEARLTVSYDGTPTFVDVQGASGLQFATNSASPVILVESTKTYYCVNNGIWFYAISPLGAWSVATVVPPVVYTIPTSSPIHYVTYVRIYGSTPEVVYVGYSPGYMGTCVTAEGVVVYGTGYVYPAYVGEVWVGYPPTYGYGVGFACGALTGFAFGFAAGAIIGDCWSHPYWGPCRGFGSVDINTHSVYTNWHGGVTTANRHYSYDAWTGESHRSGSGASFNPYTGRASAGGYSSYLDRSSGDFNVKRGGATYNPNSGVISAGGTKIAGNVYDGDVHVKQEGFKYDTKTGNGIGYKNGDVYAGHDGNVYRHTDDGWQQHTSDGWKSTGNQLSQQRQNLDAQKSSRNLGEQRFQSTRSSGRFSRTGGGGLRRR